MNTREAGPSVRLHKSDDIYPSKGRDRRSMILEAVRMQGAISVANLAAQFGVTHQTIRRDLRTLDESGQLQKGFGAAFAAPGGGNKYSYSNRSGTLVTLKRSLIRELAEFVTPGATIFVGLGTTFDSLHEIVGASSRVLIATPNLSVAHSCAMETDATIYIYGGYVRKMEPSILTTANDASHHRFKFDVAFIGGSAIDEEGSVLEFDPMEVELVRNVLQHTRTVVLIARDETFRRRAPHIVTSLAAIDVLVTNSDPTGHFSDPAVLENIRVIQPRQ
ncbi:MAG: DeoR/GlpR transcriptional regulator [Alphaproteobacteria bacterium]|nr:DeoR/GlpR transcriptional regulator [Alphaproteobacteria bacterium]